MPSVFWIFGILDWKIPWTEEPGRLQSMGSLSWTRLSDFTFTFHFPALEKEMVTHSSVLAWRIPGTGEPGGLPSMGLHRVGHDWSDLAVCMCAWIRHYFVLLFGKDLNLSLDLLCFLVGFIYKRKQNVCISSFLRFCAFLKAEFQRNHFSVLLN